MSRTAAIAAIATRPSWAGAVGVAALNNPNANNRPRPRVDG